MTTTIELIAGAMQSQAEGLRTIGQNIANSQSVAYRREIPVSHATFEQVAAADGTSATSAAAGSGVGSQAAGPARGALDLTPGTLQSTASPLHLAIEGSGFFVVSTSRGEMLTRRGDFRLDGEGQIVTQSGDPVLGTSGPIVITGDQPTISPDGTVRVGTDVMGQLRIVDVASGSALSPVGDCSYVLADGEQALESPSPTIRQGFLETSNVQTVNEMVQLMDTMRRFEAGQHFVRGYDDMMDKAITTLGRI
jgi:flagellar basal-body rod protein FlgG